MLASRAEAGEEGGDDFKSVLPLCLGLEACYNGAYNKLQRGNAKLIFKSASQFGLRAETRPHEVGIASNRRSAILR